MATTLREATNELEFRPGLVSDEPPNFVRGQDMSVMGPGYGEQRGVFDGELGKLKSRLTRGDQTDEETYRKLVVSYLDRAYRNVPAATRQELVNQAVRIPNYRNLFHEMLVASLYFRMQSGVTQYAQLTPELLAEFGPVALDAIIQGESEGRRSRANRATRVPRLTGDLLRYLRYILAK